MPACVWPHRRSLWLLCAWAALLLLYYAWHAAHVPSSRTRPALGPGTVHSAACAPEHCELRRLDTELQLAVERDNNEALRAEIARLRHGRDRQGDGTARRFLMFFPTDGPNNQLLGFKELITYAQVLNRTLVMPAFLHHRRTVNASYDFASAYDEAPLRAIGAVSLAEYVAACKDRTHIVYTRRAHPHWDKREALYRRETGLGAATREYPDYAHGLWKDHRTDPIWHAEDEVRAYFRPHHDRTCLALGFPYHNLQGAAMEARTQRNARFLRHAASIQSHADATMREVGLERDAYVAVHWRESEEGCQLEPDEAHDGFDMCFGTSGFNWVRSDDVIAGLRAVLAEQGVSAVYLATDSHEEHVIAKLRAQLPHFRRASDSTHLRGIVDNFYRSLVEQELMMRARVFAGSFYSTWSAAVSHWWHAQPKLTDRATWLEDIVRRVNGKLVLHNNSNQPPYGHIKVTYREPDELKAYLHTNTTTCSSPSAAASPWPLCDIKTPCTVLAWSVEPSRIQPLLGALVARCTVHLLAPAEMALEPPVENVARRDGALDVFAYEQTRTLNGMLDEIGLTTVDVLVLDGNGRELRVLKGAVRDGAIPRVRQIIARVDVYPVFKQNEEHWPTTLAARAMLYLRPLTFMRTNGVHVYSVRESADSETAFIVGWLNTNMTRTD